MIINNIAITAIIIIRTLRMIILIIIIIIRNIYEKFIRKTQLCIGVDENKCT